MRGKRWVGLAAVLAMVGTAQAAELAYEGFAYAVDSSIHGLGGVSNGFAGAWVSTDAGSSISAIKTPGYTWGAMTVTGNMLRRTATGGTEGVSRLISADLDGAPELWFSVIYKADDNTQFAIAGGAFLDGNNASLTDGPGFAWRHAGSSGVLDARIWNDAGTSATVGGITGTLVDDNVYLLVGKVEFNAGTGDADVLSIYSVGTDLILPGTPIASVEANVDETKLDTLTMNTNRDPNFDEIRIGTTYADVVPVSAVFAFNLTPNDSQTIESIYPATLATNSIVADFVNSANGVQITALNISSDSNEFTAVTSLPLDILSPVPDSELIEFSYNADLAGVTGPTAEGFNSTGSVDVVWTEISSGVLNTNTVELIGRYRNPVTKFNMDNNLDMVLEAPATAVTNDVTVSYIEGRPGHTNVQIIAVSITNETTAGFSNVTSLPYVIPAEEPANGTFSIAYDNALGGLTHNQSASADVVVTWQEVGATTSYTDTVAVSVNYLDLAQGVVQVTFASPVDSLQKSGVIDLNDFGAFTNKWVYNNNTTFNSAGYVQIKSANNTRCLINLVENGTAGMDNFGPVDTELLTNGLYRYDFVYEVIENTADPNTFWSIDAYALINQQVYDPSNQVDFVEQRTGDGTSSPGTKHIPVANGLSTYDLHPNGTLSGTGNVAKATGSVIVNVDSDQDAVFVMQRSKSTEIRLYEVVLTRIGDFDPNADANDPNAVIAAKFNSADSTNSIISELVETDTNTNGVSNTWRGSNVSWQNQAFESLANNSATKASVIITRAGTAGYDDVGVQDTIALTSGTYDLTLDVDVTGSFPSNDSVARVEFYSLSQDPTGNVNQVRVRHTPGDDPYLVADGTAAFTLLGSKTYTGISSETLVITNMNVLDGQDVALVFYHKNGPDLVIDNVELVRTGDAVLSGYEGWAAGFEGFFDTDLESDPDGDLINNLLEYALNGDPTVADTSILPTSYTGVDGSSNWLYYVHTERTDDGTLSYTVEAGTSLVFTNWNTAGVEFVDESGTVDNYKSVTNRTDTTDSAEFVRLQVEKN